MWTIPSDPVPVIHYPPNVFHGCACDTSMFSKTRCSTCISCKWFKSIWKLSGEFSVAKRIPFVQQVKCRKQKPSISCMTTMFINIHIICYQFWYRCACGIQNISYCISLVFQLTASSAEWFIHCKNCLMEYTDLTNRDTDIIMQWRNRRV